jgi:hypothetical protein
MLLAQFEALYAIQMPNQRGTTLGSAAKHAWDSVVKLAETHERLLAEYKRAGFNWVTKKYAPQDSLDSHKSSEDSSEP